MKMPIPGDWNGSDCCRFSVTWPDSPMWKAILFGLLSKPSQGRFWDETTGRILDIQAAFAPTYDANFSLKEVIMACGDTGVADALNAIAVALAANNGSSPVNCNCGGCAGGGAAGPFSPEINVQAHITLPSGATFPVFGSGPIPTLPTSGFPDGYADEDEYTADKCRKAMKIVNDLITTLDNLGTINWLSGITLAVVLVGCFVGIITVPYVTIPLLLFALTANVGITTALVAMEGYITDNKEEWVCYLTNNDSVPAILNAVSAGLVVAVAALNFETTIGLAVSSIVLWLLNVDVLGILFNAQAKLQYPDADCEFCIECGITFVWDGNDDDFGWSLSNIVGGTPTLEVDQPDYYTLIRHSGGGGEWHYNFISDELTEPYTIREGDTLDMHCFVNQTASLYWGFVTSENPEGGQYGLFVPFGSGTANGAIDTSSDLSEWVGQTVTKLGVYVSAAPDYELGFAIASYGFVCP